MGEVENRRIVKLQCDLAESENKETGQLRLQILLRFEDNMNRQLNCMISRSGDSAGTLAEELVLHGFIHTADSSLIQEMLDAAFIKYESNTAMQMGQEVMVQ